MMLRIWLPDAFHRLVPLETPNLTYLAVKMPVGKSGCKQRLVNCDSPTGYGMQNTIYKSLVLLIGWRIHGTVCLTALCLLVLGY